MDARLLLALAGGALGFASGWLSVEGARRLDVRWGLSEEEEDRARVAPAWHRWGLALGAGAAGAAAGAHFGPSLALVVAWCAAMWLALVAAIDLRSHIIPNRLTYPALALAPLSVLLWPGATLGEHLSGAALCAGFFLLAFIASRGALGLGDVKLALVLGAYLGLERGAVALVVTLALGGVFAVVALVAGLSRKDSIPYGPSLCAGGAVALCIGDVLWRAYLSHLGAI